jgi:hypothetical protein
MPPGNPSHEPPPSEQEPRRAPPPWPPRPPDPAPRTPPPWPPQPSEMAPSTPPPGQISGYTPLPGIVSSGRLPTGGPLSGTSGSLLPAVPPRLVPGGQTSPRSSSGHAVRPIQPAGSEVSFARGLRPRTRMPLTRALRTDPSLYQWDRLSPEQKAAVLAAIGDTPARFRLWSAARPMLIGALIVALLCVVVGVLFVVLH